MLSDNPILYREWLELRRRRPGLSPGRLTYPAMLLAPTLLLSMLQAYRAFGSLRDAAELGFAVSLFLHCLYVALRAISSTVTTVAWEKERRTLDALLATPLKPGSLLAGKYLATQVPLTLEMLLFSPLWGLFWLAGAAELAQLAELAVLTLALQALFSTLGLWASLTRGSAERAGQVAYGMLGAMTLGNGLLYLLIETSRGMEDAEDGLALVNPIFAAGSILWDEPTWWWFSLLALASALGLALTSRRRFARPEATGVTRSLRPVKGAGPEQPLAYRNWLSLRRGGFPWVAWVLYPGLVLGPAVAMGGFEPDAACSSRAVSSLFAGLAAHLTFFSLLALARACSRVAGERERGTWESLVGTLLTGRELYRSQLGAVTGPLLRQLAWSSPCLGAFVLSGQISLAGLAGIVGLSAVSIAFWGALGLSLSQRCATSVRALQIGTGCLTLAIVAPLVLDVMMGMLWGGNNMVFSAIDPLVGVLAFAHDFMPDHQTWMGPFCLTVYLIGFLFVSRNTERELAHVSGG